MAQIARVLAMVSTYCRVLLDVGRRVFIELSEGVDGILYAEEIGGEVGFGNSAGKWRLMVVGG